jgi:fluoride exporter
MSLPFLAGVAGAGAVGALLRLFLARSLQMLAGDFPLATGVINVSGCLLFGLLWEWAAGRWSPAVQAAVFTGFLGAFTTFSTFAFESVELAAAGRVTAMIANVVGQNVMGLAAVLLGRQVAAAF